MTKPNGVLILAQLAPLGNSWALEYRYTTLHCLINLSSERNLQIFTCNIT